VDEIDAVSEGAVKRVERAPRGILGAKASEEQMNAAKRADMYNFMVWRYCAVLFAM